MSQERLFRIVVSFDREREQFVARVPELDLESRGSTRAEAIEAVEEALGQALAVAQEGGKSAPEPADAHEGDGRVELHLAAELYRDLLYAARRSQLSPAELATQLLVRAVANLDGRAPRRAGPPPREAAPAEGGATEDSQPPRRDDRGRGPDRGQDRGDRGDRGRQGPGRRREGYHSDLDDKANFLEYLRGLEKGPGGRRR